MSDGNKAVAQRHIDEVWNKGNLDSMDETHVKDYIHHDPHDPWQRTHDPGPDAVKKLVHFYRNAFPDLCLTIDEIIAEGDVVVARFSSHATHKQQFGNIKPTNKTVKITGVFWWRFADGKIIEGRSYWDAHAFLRQLGAVPEIATLSE
ncbi:MAG TPA: ester cyclase [Candidatus Acidoferrales bacterium]|nr:ester cyclase [Candidatus Acidoferrales bacterium]